MSLDGKLTENQLGIYDDRLVDGLEKPTSRIHQIGTPVVIQINHAGKAASRQVTGMKPVSPSPNGDAKKLTVKDIRRLVDAFTEAAERGMKAGFDGG